MNYAESGYAGLPPICRARDYHLYARGGKRYLDMCLGGGRALFGHRPHGLYKILKNELQKGLAAEFPTQFEKRFERAFLRLAPSGFRLRLYASFDRALAAAESVLGRSLSGADIHEPFFAGDAESGGAAGPLPASQTPHTPDTPQTPDTTDTPPEVSDTADTSNATDTLDAPVYFRPGTDIDYSHFPLLFPVLPFPGNFAPQPLLLREDLRAPGGEAVSPLLLSGLTRLAEELQRGQEFPDIWSEWRLSGWRRFGCYCFPVPRAGLDYARARSRFLEEGIVLSPEARRPSILPRLYSPGERRLVERLSETIFGSST
ncbi:MAG: hypothetical protein LBK13_00305 [Spirochaetales bacterium]|jgi:hypothetical protein|nr:hypothetical protein [Spirochaetales bacterium]